MNHENERLTPTNIEKLIEILSTYSRCEIEFAYYFAIAETIRTKNLTLEEAHKALEINVKEIQEKMPYGLRQYIRVIKGE